MNRQGAGPVSALMPKATTMAKTNRKGRNKHTRFVRLEHALLNSDAWLKLPLVARVIFIHLEKRYNGRNNGEISFSCREAAKEAGCGVNSAHNHLRALQRHGLVIRTADGLFTYRQAATWELTTWPTNGQPAKNLWRLWTPAKQFIVPDTVP